jgi:peptidoglycan/LPS O-acetylase OafA/YrhL
VLENPALRLAGLVSYSVYLWHYPVLHWGLRRWGATPGGDAGATAPAIAVALVGVAFAVGAVTYLLVERPALRRKADESPSPAPPGRVPPATPG